MGQLCYVEYGSCIAVYELAALCKHYMHSLITASLMWSHWPIKQKEVVIVVLVDRRAVLCSVVVSIFLNHRQEFTFSVVFYIFCFMLFVTNQTVMYTNM